MVDGPARSVYPENGATPNGGCPARQPESRRVRLAGSGADRHRVAAPGAWVAFLPDVAGIDLGLTPRQSIELESARRRRDAVIDGCIAVLQGNGDRVDDTLIVALGGPPTHRILTGESHADADLWKRIWATRGLLWVWDERATRALGSAPTDNSWRMRELAVKSRPPPQGGQAPIDGRRPPDRPGSSRASGRRRRATRSRSSLRARRERAHATRFFPIRARRSRDNPLDETALTTSEPSGQTDSGLSALLLCVSSPPEQEPVAEFPTGDKGEVRLEPR